VDVALHPPLEVGVRRDERLLDGILGIVGGAEHVAAERDDSRTVAVEEDLERRRIAAADVVDQPLIRKSTENTAWFGQPQAMRPRRGSCFHTSIIGTDRGN
jgi:hypothetical protein